MHQDHNIPWDIVASHLKFTVPKSGDRSKMDFYPKDRATQTSDLRHFARKFAAAITEFSRTERAKYPRSFSVVMNGRIISEDVFEPYEDAGTSPTGTLNRSSVEGEPMEYRIEDWIARARTSYEYQREPLDKNLCYSTSHAVLADIIKLVLVRADQTALLTLANHPLTPIRTLRYLSWGHSFGFSWAAETPLDLYIFLNVQYILHSDHAQSPAEILKTERVQSILRWATWTMDYDAQNALQWRYFGLCGKKADTVLGDVKIQKEYMKEVFAVFYKYDMLLTECGVNPEWEKLICQRLEELYGFKGLVERNW